AAPPSTPPTAAPPRTVARFSAPGRAPPPPPAARRRAPARTPSSGAPPRRSPPRCRPLRPQDPLPPASPQLQVLLPLQLADHGVVLEPLGPLVLRVRAVNLAAMHLPAQLARVEGFDRAAEPVQQAIVAVG